MDHLTFEGVGWYLVQARIFLDPFMYLETFCPATHVCMIFFHMTCNGRVHEFLGGTSVLDSV